MTVTAHSSQINTVGTKTTTTRRSAISSGLNLDANSSAEDQREKVASRAEEYWKIYSTLFNPATALPLSTEEISTGTLFPLSTPASDELTRTEAMIQEDGIIGNGELVQADVSGNVYEVRLMKFDADMSILRVSGVFAITAHSEKLTTPSIADAIHHMIEQAQVIVDVFRVKYGTVNGMVQYRSEEELFGRSDDEGLSEDLHPNHDAYKWLTNMVGRKRAMEYLEQ